MRKILSSFLYFLPLKEPLGFSLSLLCSFQSGVGTNTPQPRPGFEARNIHPQSHSVGLQARPVTHHLSNISASILKLKVIGTNSDAGDSCLWNELPTHLSLHTIASISQRKAEGCNLHPEDKLSNYPAAAARSHCHSEDHKGPIIYCYF